ncbi:DNA-binding protein [Lasiosphaeria miniovina]|uniref:DNA-binding protein n=1 Tax=Lasiosphaeria miniovina TaxID=1954250 RepID=A0AA39ZR40_9PEZI|nr:DNA-binding protein [Lasiosphaeria miniovina]KAK0702027.1 DNA-binding protein [Lasiosphaeria miniovina]
MPPPVTRAPAPRPNTATAASSSPSLPLDQGFRLLTSFNSFLTVAIHNILFYRGIYPASTFLSARAYNLPVHQNRHPKVCSWIRDAVDAVAAQIAGGHVARIAVVVHSPPPAASDPSSSSESSGLAAGDEQQRAKRLPPPGSVLERWMFDVSRFPAWPTGGSAGGDAPKAMRDFGKMLSEQACHEQSRDNPPSNSRPPSNAAAGALRDEKVNWIDVDEQFRGALRRMAYAGEKMDSLPEGCTFTIAVELRDEALAPIGHPQAWIPAKPNLLSPGVEDRFGPTTEARNDLAGVKTMPVRSVEAGPLFFECWIEEAQARDETVYD